MSRLEQIKENYKTFSEEQNKVYEQFPFGDKVWQEFCVYHLLEISLTLAMIYDAMVEEPDEE